MDCPRCRLSLTVAEYEGEQVHFCGTCWGYWMTRSALERITGSVQYKFGNQERQAVDWSMAIEGDADREGAESHHINCPVCGIELARKRYTPECPVDIDDCEEHGVWLDTGEIKDLQVFLEQNLR